MRDSGDFLSTLKVDLYSEEVYTFTPRGRVIVLPRDATPIDFAYAIHSDVGNTCVGARVNGAIKPLKTTLRNGDVVEILTQPGHQPSRDWLAVVKTSRARNKIRHVINAVERAKAVEIGQKSLEKEARRMGVSLGRISTDDLASVASEYGVSKTEDLYAALGFGKFSARQVLQKVAPDEAEETRRHTLTFPQPCLPGSQRQLRRSAMAILRFMSRAPTMCWCIGPSAAIRCAANRLWAISLAAKAWRCIRSQCPNVQKLMYEAERKIAVEWARIGERAAAGEGCDLHRRPAGHSASATSILSTEIEQYSDLEARGDENRTDDSAVIDITIDIRDKKQLERVINGFPTHSRCSRHRTQQAAE